LVGDHRANAPSEAGKATARGVARGGTGKGWPRKPAAGAAAMGKEGRADEGGARAGKAEAAPNSGGPPHHRDGAALSMTETAAATAGAGVATTRRGPISAT